MRPPRFSMLIGAALLLAAVHVLVANLAMRDKSTTADEMAHLTAGFSFNHLNDYRLHPENGLLTQRWQALPLIWGESTSFPDLSTKAWQMSDVWMLGHEVFYGPGNDAGEILRRGRAMNSLFGAATLLLVFFWAKRLWGAPGAIIAGIMAGLCPTLLAHSALATSDMAAAFFMPASLGSYWQHLHDSRVRWALMSVAAFALALVAKYTSIILLPMLGVLFALRILSRSPLDLAGFRFETISAKLRAVICSFTIHLLVAIATIWAFSGFRFSAFNPALPAGHFYLPWDLVLSFGGLTSEIIAFLRDWKLMPEGWLYGLAFVLKHTEARAAFLDGAYSHTGWITFFPKAFLYKTPDSLLYALAGTSFLIALRTRKTPSARLRVWTLNTAPLVTLFIIYWAFSISSNLNIGHRHLLPSYIPLYIFCGALGWAASMAWRLNRISGTFIIVGTAFVLCHHALNAARTHPHYLAYFSPIAGGPAEGYKRLVDSSLDWGQDLPGLKKWIAGNRKANEPLYFSYFGTGDPEYYGIQANWLPIIYDFKRVRPRYSVDAGVYAISATMLQHVYLDFRGPWTPEMERRYQNLLHQDTSQHIRYENDVARGSQRPIVGIESEDDWRTFELLRFARLCHYLRLRRPDAMVGYSILIFRLSQHEIDTVVFGSMREFARTIKQLATQPAAERAYSPK